MQMQLDMVRLWMRKQGYSTDQPWDDSKAPSFDEVTKGLKTLAAMAYGKAEGGGKAKGFKLRWMRMALLLEELAELSAAFAQGDEAETLDALADLEYVVTGTAVAWDLPLGSAFAEVHLSNDSKDVGTGDEPKPVKGEGYKAPDIRGLLERWRRADTPLAKRRHPQNIMEALRKSFATNLTNIERQYQGRIAELEAALAEKGGAA